jgi:hypothetical protein
MGLMREPHFTNRNFGAPCWLAIHIGMKHQHAPGMQWQYIIAEGAR